MQPSVVTRQPAGTAVGGQFATGARDESAVTLTAPDLSTLQGVAAAGYCTDEWARWQQGGCLEYAVALTRARPGLRFGTLYDEDGLEAHHFAYDDVHAYDSAGRHPMPYRGLAGDLRPGLDEDPAWYDEAHPDDVAAASEHIERNAVLQGRFGR